MPVVADRACFQRRSHARTLHVHAFHHLLAEGFTFWRQLSFGSDNVQAIFSGRNLWLHTNYFGYDPESSNYGQQAITRNVDLGPYPPSRQFMFSLAVGF